MARTAKQAIHVVSLHVPDRQIFFLRRHPFRYIQFSQHLSLAHRVERRAYIQTFNEANAACLHHGYIAFVVRHAADGNDYRGQIALGDFSGTNAQILLYPRTDIDLAIVAGIIGVDRDQFHIHERRFTRFVEFLVRHHRIMPIQHFFLRVAGFRFADLG